MILRVRTATGSAWLLLVLLVVAAAVLVGLSWNFKVHTYVWYGIFYAVLSIFCSSPRTLLVVFIAPPTQP